ncbi:hypothetical protein, partial [Mycolicibacterium smegmatis]
DLDPYPGTDAPTTSTPSTAKSLFAHAIDVAADSMPHKRRNGIPAGRVLGLCLLKCRVGGEVSED